MSDHASLPTRHVSAVPAPSARLESAQPRRSSLLDAPARDGYARQMSIGYYLRDMDLISPYQLTRALTEQRQREAAGIPMSLGALLISQGIITPQDFVMALLCQQMDRVMAGSVTASARLGELLVHANIITPAQCASALYTQITSARPGMHLRFGQILIAQGLITPRNLMTVLRTQAAARERA